MDDGAKAWAVGAMNAMLMRQANEIAAQRAENERLRAALRPFALAAEHDIGDVEDEPDADPYRPMGSRWAKAPVTVGDFRRARAALKENDDG